MKDKILELLQDFKDKKLRTINTYKILKEQCKDYNTLLTYDIELIILNGEYKYLCALERRVNEL